MIRKFEIKDINEIMKIWFEVNVEAHHFIQKEYWKSKYNEVKKMLPQATVYVYQKDNEIQGFIGLINNYIAGIFVCSNVQSKGIGKQLLNHVKQINKNLRLQVYEKNERAVKFYQRENFIIESKEFDENTKETELLMICKP